MSTMIKIRIKNADHEIDIRFPISESELFAKLGEINAIEGKDAPESAFVTEVYWPEEFSMLKDRFANLDELNYLARRMESFDYHEYDQFLIGITKLENPTEKDLINLTFNLDHFTLCKDVSSYGIRKAPFPPMTRMIRNTLPSARLSSTEGWRRSPQKVCSSTIPSTS